MASVGCRSIMWTAPLQPYDWKRHSHGGRRRVLRNQRPGRDGNKNAKLDTERFRDVVELIAPLARSVAASGQRASDGGRSLLQIVVASCELRNCISIRREGGAFWLGPSLRAGSSSWMSCEWRGAVHQSRVRMQTTGTDMCRSTCRVTSRQRPGNSLNRVGR